MRAADLGINGAGPGLAPNEELEKRHRLQQGLNQMMMAISIEGDNELMKRAIDALRPLAVEGMQRLCK